MVGKWAGSQVFLNMDELCQSMETDLSAPINKPQFGDRRFGGLAQVGCI